MGSRIGRRRRQRGITLIAVSLAMLLASVPALAAQTPTGPAVSGNQNGSLPEGPPGNVPDGAVSGDQSGSKPGSPGEVGVCDHAPGEFLVGYVSEEALRAAPQENVVDTIDSIFVQHLVYGEIKNEPDPAVRSAAEEAKRQELKARPGVNYVEYNCSTGAEAKPAPPVADCGECGANIGRLAAEVIGGSKGAEGETAYEVALEAARSVDEGNVAFASEAVEGNTGEGNIGAADAGEEDMGDAGTVEEDMDATGTVEEAAGDAEETTDDGEQARETGGETTAGENASRDTGEGTVNGVAASRESRVNSPLLAVGGGMLLVAGVFLARKVFGE